MNASPYDSPNSLSQNLKALRQSLGLTQEVFAERIGMKYKHYQDLEAGRKNNLQLKTLDRFANRLKIPSQVLIAGENPANSSGYIVPETSKPLKAAEDPPARKRKK